MKKAGSSAPQEAQSSSTSLPAASEPAPIASSGTRPGSRGSSTLPVSRLIAHPFPLQKGGRTTRPPAET